MNHKLEAALRYAARGWYVFPLHSVKDGHCSCGKPSCERGNWGKHPRVANGLLDGTTDEAQIRRWWSRTPEANVGIRTGVASGLVVLDVDPPKGGDDSLERLQREHGDLPDTAETKTGTGGRHLLFQHPGRELRNSAGKLGEGLDVRGDGGYIVAPPSFNGSGQYDWRYEPGDDLAELPTWLLGLLEAPATNGSTLATPDDDTLIESGQRNAKLASIAGSMRNKGLSEEAIEAALLVENRYKCSPPLPDEEVRRIAGSISRYSTKKAPTDIENGEKFVEQHGKDVRFNYDNEQWYVWAGKCWSEDVAGAVREKAKRTAKSIGRQTQAAGKIRNMLFTAATDPALVVMPEAFDRDPWLLNVENGTIDLRTGKLRPHEKTDMLRKVAPVTFDVQATAPRFEAFIGEVIPDPDVREYVQRLLGYGLTGVVREHVLSLWHGDGANGKSTLIKAVQTILGPYGWALPEGVLIQQRFTQHPTEIADLEGRRLAFASETGQDVKLNEPLVKRLTGGETLTARRMRQDFAQFEPTHKLVLITNELPNISGTDHGIWRRIQEVPFIVTIPDEKQDTTLDEKLRAESPGILNWLLEGTAKWFAGGLRPPTAVTEATNSYREEQDHISRFLSEMTVEDPEKFITAQRLLEVYKEWCQTNGITAKTQTAFGRDMGRRFEKAKNPTNRRQMYKGIGLSDQGMKSGSAGIVVVRKAA